jgi:hypothetical protein
VLPGLAFSWIGKGLISTLRPWTVDTDWAEAGREGAMAVAIAASRKKIFRITLMSN